MISPDNAIAPPWGERRKVRTQRPARILSIRPAYAGATGPAGQSATHVVSIETEDAILDCFIDLHSATLLLAVAAYLPPGMPTLAPA